jgi:hypothetical protein
VTHDEWKKRLGSIADLQDSDPSGALDMAMRLADDSRAEAQSGLSEWHEEQALSFAATIDLELNRYAEACEIFEQLALRHRRTMAGAGHSAAQMLAEAAIARFQLGEGELGAKLAEESLRLFGQYPEPNLFLADAIKEWRRFVDGKQVVGQPEK